MLMHLAFIWVIGINLKFNNSAKCTSNKQRVNNTLVCRMYFCENKTHLFKYFATRAERTIIQPYMNPYTCTHCIKSNAPLGVRPSRCLSAYWVVLGGCWLLCFVWHWNGIVLELVVEVWHTMYEVCLEDSAIWSFWMVFGMPVCLICVFRCLRVCVWLYV